MNSEGNDSQLYVNNSIDNASSMFGKDDNLSIELPFIYDVNQTSSFFEKSINQIPFQDDFESNRVLKQVSFSRDAFDNPNLPSPKHLQQTPAGKTMHRRISTKELMTAFNDDKDVDLDNLNVSRDGGKVYSQLDMIEACKNGQLLEVERMYETGYDLNSDILGNKTALHIACQYGQLEIVEYLISRHVNVNVEDQLHRSPIHCACEGGRVSILKLLHEHGLSLEELDMNKKAPIHIACEFGRLEIVNYLISSQVNLQVEDNTKKSPLHYACERGYFNIVILLIGFGAEVNQKNAVTPLHSACKGGHLDIVQYLVESIKVDIDAVDQKKRTALHFATKKGHLPIVEYLVERKAKAHLMDSDRKLALHYACETTNLGLVKFLISLKSHIEAKGGRDVATPLLFACRSSNIDIVTYLLEDKCVRIDSVDIDYSNALHYACEGGNLTVVKYLVEQKGLDVNFENKWGLIPLAFALEQDHFHVVDYLISKNSSVENINEHGDGLVNMIARDLLQQDLFTMKRRDLLRSCMRKNATGRIEKLDLTMRFISQTKDLNIIALSFVKYLPLLPSPISFLNSELSGNNSGDDSNFMLIFKKHLIDQDPMILFYMVQCIRGLNKAAELHFTESTDLIDVRKKIEIMVNEIFGCTSFDEHETVLQILNPVRFTRGEKVNELSTFEDDSIVRYCLDRDISNLFDKPQINNLIVRSFYSVYKTRIVPQSISIPTNMKKQTPHLGFSFYAWSFSFVWDTKTSERRHHFQHVTDTDCALEQKRYLRDIRYTHALRCNPGIEMFGEFISKTILLLFVGIVVVNYGDVFKADYSRHPEDDNLISFLNTYTPYEIWLVIIAVMDMIFEIGQIVEEADEGFSFHSIVASEWNVLDRISSSLLIAWIVLRFVASHEFPAARVVLAVAAIPMSSGILRYLSIYEPLGELVILIKAMTMVITNVVLIYFVCIVGFGITFYSLYSGIDELYSSPGFIVLTLLKDTLLDFNFEIFTTNNDSVNILGILLLVGFLVFTAIVLMNLLIAQMSSSYEKIKEQSRQQLSFVNAKLVAEYMLLKERHIFCMLPAPLNIFPILVWPLHLILFRCFHLSLGGTATNVLYSALYGMVFRLFHHLKHLKDALYKKLPDKLDRQQVNPLYRFTYTCTYVLVALLLILLDTIFLPWIILAMEVFMVREKERRSLFADEVESNKHSGNARQEPEYLYLEFVDEHWNIFYPRGALSVDQAKKDLSRSSHSFKGLEDDDAWELMMDEVDESETVEDSSEGSGNLANGATKIVHRVGSRTKSFRRKISKSNSLLALSATQTIVPMGSKYGMISPVTETPSKIVYFKENDIPRILRPLKSYIKSLNTIALQRLESNVSQETLRLRNDIGNIIDKEMTNVRQQTQEGQESLKNDLLVAQNKFTKSINTRIENNKLDTLTHLNGMKDELSHRALHFHHQMKQNILNEVTIPAKTRQDELRKLISTTVSSTAENIVQEIMNVQSQVSDVEVKLDEKLTETNEGLSMAFGKDISDLQTHFHSELQGIHGKISNMESSIAELVGLMKEMMIKQQVTANINAATSSASPFLFPQTMPTPPQVVFHSDGNVTIKPVMQDAAIQTIPDIPKPAPPAMLKRTETITNVTTVENSVDCVDQGVQTRLMNTQSSSSQTENKIEIPAIFRPGNSAPSSPDAAQTRVPKLLIPELKTCSSQTDPELIRPPTVPSLIFPPKPVTSTASSQTIRVATVPFASQTEQVQVHEHEIQTAIIDMETSECQTDPFENWMIEPTPQPIGSSLVSSPRDPASISLDSSHDTISISPINTSGKSTSIISPRSNIPKGKATNPTSPTKQTNTRTPKPPVVIKRPVVAEFVWH